MVELFDQPTEKPTIGAASFSRLEVFEKCPLQAKYKFIDRRPEPDMADRTEALNRGILLHQTADRYIKGESDDTTGLQLVLGSLNFYRDAFQTGNVMVEQEWAFAPDWTVVDWFDDTVSLRVKLDVAYLINERELELTDWKSGKKDGREVKHISQAQLYVLCGFIRYPLVERVTALIQYTDFKATPIRRTYTRADFPRLVDTWTRRIGKMTTATDFPARPNKINCLYCPYGPTKGDNSCPWGVPA